ncbi:MAG: ribosome maturation factor RimM [Bacteroidales bacterium]|nr:ribosome maturation factor RimM [Bacteroidales bacterium]MCF8328288.1 ribosome maturation factor RimM [Bacteroidales bacterium]
MINRKDFFHAGVIKKTFGVEGELIFLFLKEFQVKIKEKEPVFPEIEGNLVPFFIENFQWHNDNELRLKLEDINSKETAEQFTGYAFYLPLSLLEDDENNIQFYDLVGFQIIDETAGPLGKIKEIIEQPAQDLMIIESETREIMIPLVTDYILNADSDQKTMYTQLPEGLLDINE